MALIAAIHRNSPRTLVSFHGLLHAAIAGQFLNPATSTFPPENPFFAGQPVAYYWFFQYLAAQVTRFFDVNIFYSLEAIILVATGTLMVTAVFLGRKVHNSSVSGIIMGYLIVAGTNPFGWVHLVRRVASSGRAVLSDDPSHLWNVVHPLYSLIRYNDIGGLYGPLFNFFLNITSRPAALASLLLTVLCLRWALQSGRTTALISIAAATALTTAFSPIVGIATAGMLSAGLIVSWLWNRILKAHEQREPGFRNKTRLLAVPAISAGILLAAPTYYNLLTGPSSNQLKLALFSTDGIRHVITVASSIFLLVILAVLGLIKSKKIDRELLGILTCSALVLCLLDLIFSLPAGNTSNLFHAAVVLLAVPAAGSIVHRNSKGESSISRRLAFGIVLVFLPTFAVLVTAYLNRPPLPASFQSERIVRTPFDSDRARLYQWVKNETDARAVFVVDPRERTALCGNAEELPAMTGRSIFTEDYRHYMVEPYADSKLRFEMAVRLVTGEQSNDSDQQYMAKLNRRVYIVIDGAQEDHSPNTMQSIYGPPVFHAESISVYQWPVRS